MSVVGSWDVRVDCWEVIYKSELDLGNGSTVEPRYKEVGYNKTLL